MSTDPTPDRIPIGRSIVYAVRGLPDVPNQYGSGSLIPTEITLTYRASADSQLGRISAYVKGRWRREGKDSPTDEKLPGQHYYGDLADWPEWLAEEARLHDPDAPLPVLPPDGRAAILREAADECDKAGAAYTARALNDHAAGAFALMETFFRKANEAEYVAAPCDFAACEPGGEPCSTHERLMAHGEGDHELCGPECRIPADELRRLAAGEQDEQQAQQGDTAILAELQQHLTDHTPSCNARTDHLMRRAAWALGMPRPAHVGGNAEKCPGCEGTNPSYPFICPQPEPAASPVAGQPPADTGEEAQS